MRVTKKRALVFVLPLLVMALMLLCFNFDADAKTGKWKKDKGGWYYSYGGKSYAKNAWVKTGSKWYYCNAKGYMVTGWKKIKKRWYYFAADGAMQTGWKKLSGKWYYFGNDGMMVSGWKKISGKSGSFWYFFKDGVMLTGWNKIQNKWYYMKPADGAVVTGLTKIGKKTYMFNSSGAMQTGWMMADDVYTYFDPKSGARANGWQQINDNWYYFEANGRNATGFKYVGKKLYYFDDVTFVMRKNENWGGVVFGKDGSVQYIKSEFDSFYSSYSVVLYPDGRVYGYRKDQYHTSSSGPDGEYIFYASDFSFHGTYDSIKSFSNKTYSFTLKSFAYDTRVSKKGCKYPNDADITWTNVDNNATDSLISEEWVVGSEFLLYLPGVSKSYMTYRSDMYLANGGNEWAEYLGDAYQFDANENVKQCVIDNPKYSRSFYINPGYK